VKLQVAGAAGSSSQMLAVELRFSLLCSSGSRGTSLIDWLAQEEHAAATVPGWMQNVRVSARRRLLQYDADGNAIPDPAGTPTEETSGYTENSAGLSAPDRLNSVYYSLLPLLGDFDSPVWQGVLSSQMDRSVAIRVTDPSGKQALAAPNAPQDCFNTECVVPTPPSEEGEGSSSWFGPLGFVGGILVIAGGAVLLLVLVAACVIVYRKRSSADAAALRLHMSSPGQVSSDQL